MSLITRTTAAAGLALGLLVTQGCSVFTQSPSSPLHAAAWRGDVALVQQLVQQGADVNTPDAAGFTPLYWAAQGGHRIGPHLCGTEDPERVRIVSALLDLGANPNLPDRRPRRPGGSSGWTPVFVALHHQQFASAALLLSRGADPNVRSDQGMTVMEMATVEGAPRELIALITSKGFDPELR